MKEVIKLDSRYPEDNNSLIRIGEEGSKRYRLKTEFSFRCGLIDDDPNKYSFVDPSGGPFMQIGSKVEDQTIKAITFEPGFGVVIEFE